MSALRLGDFQVGTVHAVAVGDAAFPFRLDKAQELPDSGREGGSFRLEFLGPSEPVLPQATYRFANADVEHEIFIVPVARDANSVRYEAVFY